MQLFLIKNQPSSGIYNLTGQLRFQRLAIAVFKAVNKKSPSIQCLIDIRDK